LTKNRKGGLAADFFLSRLIVRLENAPANRRLRF